MIFPSVRQEACRVASQMSSDMEEDGLEMGGGGRKRTGDRDILAQAQVSRSLSVPALNPPYCFKLVSQLDFIANQFLPNSPQARGRNRSSTV